MKLDGTTVQLGLIGCPVGHTFSPAIHNYIADSQNDNCIYCAWNVESENLEAAVRGMRAMNIQGFNVTIPHKINIMKYIDEISPQAEKLGSVNTVVNRNGILTGYNTDADGFFMSLEAAEIDVKNKNVLILGAGGVVSPLLMRIISEKPSSVTVLNRTHSRADELAIKIKEKTGFEIKTSREIKHYDVVINTTSAGMTPKTEVLPIDEINEIESMDFIDCNTAVVDLIYNPKETKFLYEARIRGAKTLNGLDMLINQAVISYELFMNKKINTDIYEKIKKEVFGE